MFSLSLSIPIMLLMFGFDYLGLAGTLGIEGYEGYLLFALATPVQFIAGYQFYVGTYYALRNRRANMDTLIAIGSSAAYFYSVVVVFLPSMIPLHHRTYFDTSAMIISLILFGKFLEAKAKGRTSQAITQPHRPPGPDRPGGQGRVGGGSTCGSPNGRRCLCRTDRGRRSPPTGWSSKGARRWTRA